MQSDFSHLLRGITVVPRESKNKVMQDFWGEGGGGGYFRSLIGHNLFFFENVCNSVLPIEMQCTKILMRFRLHFVDVLRFRIHFDAFRPPVLTKSLSVFIENASI